jgi:hypothetical protein
MNIETEMLRAGYIMTAIEQLENKSDEYKRGFYAGIELANDFTFTTLFPQIERANKAISKMLETRSRQS